jgi:uncharacterized protein (TIGR03083 family)
LLEYLDAIRGLSADLARLIRGLSDTQWDTSSNCPPWRVRELAAHLCSSGEGFVDAIRQGLAGSLVPSASADVRAARHDALVACSPAEVADALLAVTSAFVGMYDGLDEQQLETICFHRRGNRSIRWYAAHRLAEVAFHGWDLRTSLGLSPRFDDQIALRLLPTLLESNAPRTYAAGMSAVRGRGETYRLSVVDDPGASWFVRVEPDALTAARSDAGVADVTVAAPAGALALLVYGRAGLASEAFTVSGDTEIADRFAHVFPRP